MKLLLALALCLTPAFANITLDGSAVVTDCTGQGAVCAYSQTFAGTATHAIIAVGWFETPPSSIQGVTIGSILSCSNVQANDGTHQSTTELWICPLASTGTITVNVTISPNPGTWFIISQSVKGGKTSSYTDGTAGTTVSAETLNSISASVTTGTAGSWVFSTCMGNKTSVSVGSNQTSLGIVNNGTSTFTASYQANVSPAGSVSHSYSWTGGSSGFASQTVWALKPASFVGGSPNMVPTVMDDGPGL